MGRSPAIKTLACTKWVRASARNIAVGVQPAAMLALSVGKGKYAKTGENTTEKRNPYKSPQFMGMIPH